MKRILIIMAMVCAFAPFARAQGVRFGDQSSVTSVQTPGGPIFSVPNASISFCSSPANAVPCTNKVTTYTDITLTTPCSTSTQVTLSGSSSCVATTDQFGNWGVWVPSGTYSYTITLASGASIGPYTATLAAGGGGGSTPGGVDMAVQVNHPLGTLFGDAANFSYNPTTFALSVTGNITSTGAIASVPLLPATSGANQVSQGVGGISNYWTGSASAPDQWGPLVNLGSGTNPQSELQLGHSGSTGPLEVDWEPGIGNQAITFNYAQTGSSCPFSLPITTAFPVYWQMCVNGSDLQWEHPGAGGNGRFHVDSDFLVGPPGNATLGTNFNSFAWDNQGQYFDAGNGGNNFVLWEIANSVTPAAGIPINSQENIYPIFQNPCTSCTGTVAIGGTGVNPAVGNPVPNPYWILNAFPVVDGFTATLQHIGFSANHTFTFPNATGTIQLTNQPFITASANPALAGVLRLSHSDSINFRNNANSADDTITASAADLPLWNGGAWPGSGGGGVTFPLAANQNANNADTILYTRFTDTSPTGFAWRLQNHAASSTLASLDVSGNLIANTLTLNNQSTFTLLPTGSVQPFFYAESATSGAANIHPGFYEASASPANAFNTFWYPCTAAGKACLSATTPSADSSQTLVIHGPVNAQTGTTYTIADADEDDLTTYNNAGSIAVTLACPSGANFLNGWKNEQQQIGAGNPTITVSGCTINGGSTVVVPATGLELRSDGTNYRALFNGSGGSGPTLQTIEVNNTTQSLLDFDASAANVTGLAVTPSNPSGGKEVMEVSGNLNAANITGTIAASHIANIPLNQVISPTSAPAPYSLAGTWNFALDNATAATVSTTNATPTAQLCAHYWATGGVDTDSCLGETMSFAAGLNGKATVTFVNPATTGGTLFDFSNGGTQSDSITCGPTTSSSCVITGVLQLSGGGTNGSISFGGLQNSSGTYNFKNASAATTLQIASTGIIARYDNIVTVGNGLGAENYNTAATSQTASIGATTMVTAPAADTNYEFQAYIGQLNAGTTCTTAGSVGVNLVYTDPITGSVYTVVLPIDQSGGTAFVTTVPLSSSTLTVSNTGSVTYSFRAKASTNIQVSTTYTAGTCGTGQAYNFYPKLFQQ